MKCNPYQKSGKSTDVGWYMTLWKYKLNEVCDTCIGLIQENLIEFLLQYCYKMKVWTDFRVRVRTDKI